MLGAQPPVLTPRGLLLSFCIWEAVYWAVRLVLSGPKARRILTPIVRRDAPAYVVSTFHAIFAASRGVRHIIKLWYAPAIVKLHIPADIWLTPDMEPYMDEARTVIVTNTSLAGYLLSDLTHVLLQYPNLGKFDTVAHHFAFLCCAVIAGSGNLYPFMFSWLIIGESSTPFLNVRWFLIRQGLGHTIFMKLVSIAFAVTFFVTRFCMYGTGLVHALVIYRAFPPGVSHWGPATVMSFVLLGFVLNLVWLAKIAKLVFSSARGKSDPAKTRDTVTAGKCVEQANSKES